MMLKKMLTLVIAAVPLCLVSNMSIAGTVTFVNKTGQKVYVCPFPITLNNINKQDLPAGAGTGTSTHDCVGLLFPIKANKQAIIKYHSLNDNTKSYTFWCSSNGNSLSKAWSDGGNKIDLKYTTCN
jgi:hypothetical protein